MITINSRLASPNLKIGKSLARLIQGFIYRHLPDAEHEGYRHEPSGKIFKRTNFDFLLNGADLRVRFTSYEPEFEKIIALAALKDGLNLGKIHILDTTVAVSEHRTTQSKARLQGCVICSVQGLLGHKVFLEPQDSRHLEMMKTNGGEFELNLLRQDLEKPLYFYYGNNQTPAKAWPAVWDIKALPELINTVLDAGVGGGCMNCGAGFLETI